MSAIPRDAAEHLTEWLGDGWDVQPLAGDASVRAYYRIVARDGRRFMLAYYPEPVRPQLTRFLRAYEAVRPHAPVPAVHHSSSGAVLQDDVGDRTLLDVLQNDRREGLRLYRRAVEMLAELQKARDREINPPFTATSFFSELEMAREYYVEKLMGEDGSALVPMLRAICEDLAEHPRVLCHRDFHGQNIHILNDSLYLIDYQDLRLGPDTYDLASLLRDRGVARILGEEAELELLELYRTTTGAAGDVRRRYFQTLLQRSVKILGTFARQPIGRGRMHYLEFIPPTLESIGRCLTELPEYASLRDIFPLRFDVDAARERARMLNEAG